MNDNCGDTLPPGKTFHPGCWSQIACGLKTTPPIYQKLRPITPARAEKNKPFTVILGDCGVGKSVTAAELLEHQARSLGLVPLWQNAPELLLKIRSTFDSKEETEEQVIRKYSKAPLLCLDDVAAEKISDYSISTLYMVINQRGEYGRPTIVTSNLTLDAIAQRLDDRIANRLHRYGHVITLTKNNVMEKQAQ